MAEKRHALQGYKNFEQWLYVNMYYVIGFIGFIYIFIEGTSMGMSVTFDNEGNVSENYKLFVLFVDIAKTIYLATVEAVFMILTSIVFTHRMKDGFQAADLWPITLSALMTILMTFLIVSIYMVDRGYITLGPGENSMGLGFLNKPLIGRDYTTIVVILISLLVTFVRAAFKGIELSTIKEENENNEDSSKDVKSKKKSKIRKESKSTEKETDVNIDDDPILDDNLIRVEWKNNYTHQTLESLFQRLISKDEPKPKMDVSKIKQMKNDEIVEIFEFIIEEGITFDGLIDRKKQDIAARVAGETWEILEATETLRSHKEVVDRFSAK